MKKIYTYLVLVILLVSSFAGCSSRMWDIGDTTNIIVINTNSTVTIIIGNGTNATNQ